MFFILKEVSTQYDTDLVWQVEAEFETLAEVAYYLAQHEPIDYMCRLVTPSGEDIALE